MNKIIICNNCYEFIETINMLKVKYKKRTYFNENEISYTYPCSIYICDDFIEVCCDCNDCNVNPCIETYNKEIITYKKYSREEKLKRILND